MPGTWLFFVLLAIAVVTAWLGRRALRTAPRASASLAAFVPGFTAVVERCRGWLRERIAQALRGQPYAGVTIALVMGDQRDIGLADWKVL